MKNKKDRAKELVKVQKVRYRRGAQLKSYPNVTGIGVGFKYVKGRKTRKICIAVFVKKKKPLSELRSKDIIPQKVEGILTDVVEAQFRTLQDDNTNILEHRRRHNPLIGGISIGRLSDKGSGTLGVSVLDHDTLEDAILSNWHVLCQKTSCTSGDLIIQPGSGVGDSGGPDDVVGTLYKWERSSDVDAAVARVTGERSLLGRDIYGIGPISGMGTARLEMPVTKSGRTSGLTTGTIDYTDWEGTIGDGELVMQNQILVTGLALRGDSGSAVIDDTGRIVGLVFASDLSTYYMANHISVVCERLGISAGISVHDLIASNVNLLFVHS